MSELKAFANGVTNVTQMNKIVFTICCWLQQFSTLYGTYFPLSILFKMSSAICLNLDQSKILSSGNGLKHFQTPISCYSNDDEHLEQDRKLCGKRRKCFEQTFSPHYS